MARNRASMREGPLAELFRATEAAQKQTAKSAPEGQQLSTEPELPIAADEPPVSPKPTAPKRGAPRPPTPIRAVEPAREPEPVADRPVARWLDPLPEQPARLERARDASSYL
nr:hypothetical protein [Actinomycetota bacterium]